MAKTITLGLVLGTALTAAQPVWAADPPIQAGTGTNSIIFNDLANNKATSDYSTAFGENTTASGKWSTAFGRETKAGILRTSDGLSEVDNGIYATAWGFKVQAGAIKLSEDDVTTGSYTDRGLTAKTYTGNYATAFGTETLAIGVDSVAMGLNSTASGSQSFAMGSSAIASNTAAVAMGSNAKASANYAFAAGRNSEASGQGSVAIGTYAKANSDYSVAIGMLAQTGLVTAATPGANEVINEFAVGGGIGGGKTYYSQITGVAYGVNPHDAATYGQIITGVSYNGSTSTLTLTKGDGTTLTTTISGGGSGDSVVGTDGEISVTEGSGTDAGKKVIGLADEVKNHMNAVKAYVTDSGLNANSKKITNVADGSADGDAVNYGQVKDGMKGLVFDSGTNKLSYTTLGSAETQYVDLSSLAGAGVVGTSGEISVTDGSGENEGKKVIGLDSQVKEKLNQVETNRTNIGTLQNDVSALSGRVDSLGNRIDKVGAGAAALAALHPMDFDPDNKMSFSAGLGNYKSRNAVALGVFYRPVNNVMFSMGATVGNDNNMVNMGVSFALDRKVKLANGLSSAQLGKASRETLVNEVQLLAAENTKLNDKVKDLDDKVAKLMKMIESMKNK